MLVSSVPVRTASIAVRDWLWALLLWWADAISRQAIPLTGDPDIDAELIESYLRHWHD